MIRNCWEIIQQIDNDRLNTQFQPLVHIDRFLTPFDLSPLAVNEARADLTPDFNTIKPGFSNLTDEVILALRYCLYAQERLDTVSNWTEKLMRFCEIRYSSLIRRCARKCETGTAARGHILHIAVLLMDQLIATNDLRYLNTALKLMELRGILNKKNLHSDLSRNNDEIELALFQFRLVLATEYAVCKLHEGAVMSANCVRAQ